MGLEIERRFLVKGNGWKKNIIKSKKLCQGYLIIHQNNWTIRVRVYKDETAYLTLKSPLNEITNYEFEYEIPLNDAESLLNLTEYKIEKTRHELDLGQGQWIVDCFEAKNSPLILAEVEISEPNMEIETPCWCGREITTNKEFSNAALAQHPICSWTKEKRT